MTIGKEGRDTHARVLADARVRGAQDTHLWPAGSIHIGEFDHPRVRRPADLDRGADVSSIAVEVGEVIERLGKRIDRFVISHGHPDQYAGFEYLTGRFPGVQLAALPAVRVSLIGERAHVLAVRRSLFGDRVAARAAIPDATQDPQTPQTGVLP